MSKLNEQSSRWDTIKYFKKEDFDCRCGCGLNNIDYALVFKLDSVRKLSGIPIFVNSACRCHPHNKIIGSTVGSSHPKGLAIDIRIRTPTQRFKILNALIKVGFSRIGIYRNFIHIDLDLSKVQNLIWYR